MTVDGLLERRLLVVTGKGGVGRTTVAAALGLAAAGRGLRTIVAGVGGRDDLPRLFGVAPPAARPRRPAATAAPAGSAGSAGSTGSTGPTGSTGSGGGERELVPGLHSIGIDPVEAMEEYLRDQLPVAAVADLLSSSRTFGYLAAATPGLRELLTIGKVWELAQPQRRQAGAAAYDLVILDGPATGYGVGLLVAPRTFAKVARRGPISRHAATIHATLVDPGQTGVVGVTTAEEAAVGEVLATEARLRGELGIELGGVIVNAVRRRRFAATDRGRLRAVGGADVSRATGRAVEVALEEDDRIRVERVQIRRLAGLVAEQPVELPFVGGEEIGREALGRLGELLMEAG